MALHSLEECPQKPVIDRIEGTLDRLEKHGERTALALEQIAGQGATQLAHSDKLIEHTKQIDILFDKDRDKDDRLRIIELARAKHLGAEAVHKRESAFWERVKATLAPYTLAIFIFIVYVIDKYNITDWVHKIWKEIKS